MKLMKSILLLIFLSTTASVQAQYIKDYKREADKFYAKGDWQSAAIYYERFLNDKKGPGKINVDYNPYAVRTVPQKKDSAKNPPTTIPENDVINSINNRIGECYYKLNNFFNAEPWFAKVDKTKYPISNYYQAVCLRALARYGDAETEFTSFLNDYKVDDEYSKNAKAELENLKFIMAQLKSNEQKLYVVKKMPQGINTTEHGQNTAPYLVNNKLYFTSSRPDTLVVNNKKKVVHNNNLFVTENGSSPVKTNIPTAEGMHQGSACFTANGKTVYFTRWPMKGTKIAAIYQSNLNEKGEWSEPVKLGTDINVDGYSSQQPTITSDGKYFLYASNKPSGKGKFDIYYASLSDGKISSSTNIGEPINSAEDETTPFYHNPSFQMVFSSAGRVGMGGYDLFVSKGNFGSAWSEPKNLGYPVNSQKDEQYFYSNDDKFLLKNFYISSDRGSECCLELFFANKLIKKWITGKVVNSKSGDPVVNATINVTNENGVQLPAVNTDDKGMYFIETDPFNSLKGIATKEKYEPSEKTITADFNIDTLSVADWQMTPIPPPPPPPPVITEEKPLVVRFDFDSSNILPQYQESLDSLAAMMNREKNMFVEIGGYTDQKGDVKYNLNLSQRRSDAAKVYLIQKYSIDEKRLSTKGYGKCCPIETETNPDGSDNPDARAVNRRLEFKLILMKKQ